MKILVTGSEGMIGHKVCDLLEGTCDLVKADKKTGIDLRSFEICQMITEGVDQLYHVAGVKGSGKMTRERPADFFVPMLQMNTNILEAARLNGVKKILYVSSTAVTHDEYPGFAKEAGEKQLEAYKIQYGFDNWVIIRPNSVYGEYDNFDPDDGMFIPALMAKVKRGDKLIDIGSGYDIRDFTYGEDVATMCHVAMQSLIGTIEFGAEPHYTVDVAEALQKVANFRYYFSGSPGTERCVNNSWGIDFTSLEEGIRKTWEWYVKQP